jgi:hypothetical protein
MIIDAPCKWVPQAFLPPATLLASLHATSVLFATWAFLPHVEAHPRNALCLTVPPLPCRSRRCVALLSWQPPRPPLPPRFNIQVLAVLVVVVEE